MNDELKEILLDILNLIQCLSINDNYVVFAAASKLYNKIKNMEENNE